MTYQIDQIFQKIKNLIAPSPVVSKTVPEKLMLDTTICPYCTGKNIVKRGWRIKKLEKVQLLICQDCKKTFTPHHTAKGKHYPLATIFDAVSLYNLGYSLEEACRIINAKQQKTALTSGFSTELQTNAATPDLSAEILPHLNKYVNTRSVDLTGVAPARPDLRDPERHWSRPAPNSLSPMTIQPSTVSNWLAQFREMMPFNRMRAFTIQKYSPQQMVVTATLAHRQLYRFRFHRAKAAITMQEHFHHRNFAPLIEFLQMIPSECPHQYFSSGERASETPLTFSKTAMIVRGKTNFATQTASFVLQGAKERKNRHEILQKFMLYNDSVTVATEVPVYLTRDDLTHMQTQLGFEIHNLKVDARNSKLDIEARDSKIEKNQTSNFKPQGPASSFQTLASNDLPKLITGHIDFLQIRNGQIHILDFKPNAEKERPIEQLTLYAMALSRLTGLRLFEFKCAWFDEKDYFEFFPLHVLHKPKKAVRRRKVDTTEGIYAVNKNENKIERIRPL